MSVFFIFSARGRGTPLGNTFLSTWIWFMRFITWVCLAYIWTIFIFSNLSSRKQKSLISTDVIATRWGSRRDGLFKFCVKRVCQRFVLSWLGFLPMAFCEFLAWVRKQRFGFGIPAERWYLCFWREVPLQMGIGSFSSNDCLEEHATNVWILWWKKLIIFSKQFSIKIFSPSYARLLDFILNFSNNNQLIYQLTFSE